MAGESGKKKAFGVFLLQTPFFFHLYETASVAVLEFLATSAGARVIASRQLVLYDRSVLWLAARVLRGRCLLVGVSEPFLVQVLFCLSVLLGRPALLWRGFLNVLLHFGNCTAHQYSGNAVVHAVHHTVEQFDALKLEDEQRVFLLV